MIVLSYRKRSITEIIESHRSFQILFEHEERILNNFERHIQTLEPISTDINKLRKMAKPVTV